MKEKANKLDLVMKYKMHTKAVNYIEKESDEYFFSCSDDGTVIRWKMTSSALSFEFAFKLLKTFSMKYQIIKGHTDRVTQVLRLDRNLFCSCSDDKTIRFYRTSNDKEPEFINELKADDMIGNFISMLQFDNNLLVTASSDNKLRFWNYETKTYLKEKTIEKVKCSGVDCMGRVF